MKTKLVLTVILTSFLLLVGCSNDTKPLTPIDTEPLTQIDTEPLTPIDNAPSSNTEVFTFSSNGNPTNAKIYLPDSYETNANLPTIYLIDYQEIRHSELPGDEFTKVIGAVNRIKGFDALVVTLARNDTFNPNPEDFQEYYTIFKDMASYVDGEYTNNTSRTFIGRGSEAGIVIMALFKEDSETSVFDNFIASDSPIRFNSEIKKLIERGDFPQNKENKKLHFSFSASNDFNSCDSMIKKINEAEYSWLQFASKQYTSNYDDTYPTAYAAGIEYIFN